MQYHWNLLTVAKEVVARIVIAQGLSKAAVVEEVKDVVTLLF